MRILLVTLFFTFCAFLISAQVVIWEEDFSSYPNGTTTSAKWSSSFTNCDGTGFWGVSGGAFTVNDIEGSPCGCGPGNPLGGNMNTWLSQGINITGYACVAFSLTIDAFGDFECNFPNGPTTSCDFNGHDQAIVEYSTGGAFIMAAYICGSDGAGLISVSDLTGTNLRIRVRLGNQSVGETYTIDDIRVTGTLITPPTITGPSNVCAGGSITLTANPGTFSDYQWSNGDNGQSITVTTAGTYRVTATDANGCQAISNPRVITLAPPPVFAITGPTQVCPGGTITLSTNNAFAGYEWSTGETTRDATIDAPGTYRVTVTDAAGCTGIQTRNITAAPIPNVSITGPTSFCTGSSITLNAVGAGITSYRWSNNATSQNISVNQANTYTVTVTNNLGCTNERSVDITEYVRPTLLPVANVTNCGPYELQPINGFDLTGNEAYYSGPNGTGTRFLPSEEITTSRSLYAYDGITGCNSQQQFSIIITPKPAINDIPDQSVCDAYILPQITGSTLTNGRAYYTGMNGTGTKFLPGDSIKTTRTLFIFDGTATCNDQESFMVSIMQGPSLNGLPDTSICSGFTLPPITGTNLSAGNSAYYTLPGAMGTRLNPGEKVTTTQKLYIYNGTTNCYNEKSVEVTITSGPQIDDIRDTTVCNNYTLPPITGMNLSGNEAYYTASEGMGTKLNPGDVITTTQTLYAYDTDGVCAKEDTFTITIASTPIINDLADVNECGFFILPAITGTNLSGSEAYYTQSNRMGTQFLPGDTILTTSTLFIYDGAPGCNDEESVVINILPSPVLTPLMDQSPCNFYILPAITGSDLSGNEAYFSQSNGAGTQFAPGDTIQTPGTFYIFDNNGTCNTEVEFVINILPAPSLNSIADRSACGHFVLQAIQGSDISNNAAYFTQPNGAGTKYLPGDTLKTTTTLYTYDINGTCTAQDTFEIIINPNPTASIRTTDVTCNGGQNGSLEVVVQGNAPFRFDWNVNLLDGQQNIAGVPARNYTVVVIDVNNCITSANATINEPAALELSCDAQSPASATNVSDGTAQVMITNGVAPYLLSWSGPVNGSRTVNTSDPVIISNLSGGGYEITLTDANGCSTTCNFSISTLGCDIIIDLVSTDASCASQNNGSIITTITGATLPIQYDWNVDALDGIKDPTGLAPGNYILNAIDANNCIISGNVEVESRFISPEASISYSTVTCEGDCFEFDIELTGTPPFSLEYQLTTNIGDIFRTININSNQGILEVCPAAVNTTRGSIIVQFLRLRDANCENQLNLRDTLLVNPISRDTVAAILCSTESVLVNGRVYNQEIPRGEEILIGGAVNGCDSIITIDLSFYPIASSDLNETICETDNIIVNGTTYDINNPSGSETLIGAAANGCDSIININLQFFPRVIADLNETICETANIVINGTTYDINNPSGTETLVGAAVNGCDSIINVSLQFFPPVSFSLNEMICETDNIVVNGTTYDINNPSGIETLVGAAVNGCDSIININLQFFPRIIADLNETICETGNIIVNGTIYDVNNPTGTETLTGGATNGCDSIVNINLQFFPRIIAELNETICETDNIIVNGTVYDVNNPNGTETLIGAARNGCDSIVNVNVQFFPAATFNLNQTICENANIIVNGTTYDINNPTGTETLVGASVNNCDSIVNINLQFISIIIFDLNQTICADENIVINGTIYNQNNPTGTEIFPGGSATGCDSLVNINLRIFPPAVFDLNSTLCEGENIIVNGIIYDQNNPIGTEIITGGSVNGCDSTVNVRLTFLEIARTSIDTTLCPGENIIVNGIVYDVNTTSGTETISGAAVNGCDSIIQVQVRFLAPTVFNLNQTICENANIIVNGTTYDINNPTGTEILAGASVNGCDSLVNISLQFFPPVVMNLDTTLCEGETITINGTIYNENNASGTEIFPATTVNGCDSLVNVNVIFLPPATFNLNPTICENDSILVNGMAYNIINPSGTETLIGAAVNGCDSIVNISLNFFPPATFDLNQTLCEGDSIIVNGNIYNQNNPGGRETFMGASVNGCDSVVNVNLTFLRAVRTTLDTILCPGESLIVNGITYNENRLSGTEIISRATSNGCDSIIQINLRYREAVTGSIEGNASICAGDSTTLTFRLNGAPIYDIRYSNGLNTFTLNDISDRFMIQVAPSQTTTYNITFLSVDGASCPAQLGSGATVQVSNLAANATITSNYMGFGVSCFGEADGVIRADGMNGVVPITYSWNTGAITQQLQGITAGNYTVTLTDAAGCMASAAVTVNEPTQIMISNDTQSPACASDKTGVIIIENITGGAAPYEVSLNGTSYRAVNGFPYQITNLAAGNYTVIIRDANDCETNFNTAILAPSVPKVDLGPDLTIRLGDSIELVGLTNFNPTNIAWKPTNTLSTPDALRTFVNVTETTTFTLNVSDTSGCKASDQITVFLDRSRAIFIPTGFTPDGDGVNDFFFINGGNDVARIKELRIFDRWGNMMFRRGEMRPNDPQLGWDGTFNGKKVNIGVYVYYAAIEFIDGITEIFEGDITVVR